MYRRPSSLARKAQWLVLLGLALAAWVITSNAADNLALRHVPFGFAWLGDTANFDIPFHLIDFAPTNTYARALLVCVLNTLLVSAMGIVTATLLGLLVGIMRLSMNGLIRGLALGFIEVIRNTPLLVQIVFWYVAVLQSLPGPRQSLMLGGGVLLNIRGIYLPVPVMSTGYAWLAGLSALLVLATPLLWRRWGPRALVLPLVALGVLALGVERIDVPTLRGFNVAGGVQLPPELAAVWAGLSIYSAAFIAEIVRSTIQAVPRGQREAALSLGLKPAQVLWHVVLPQAARMMVPPMTSQYLNLIKGSSLGAAVAYPEIFQIFAGTVLNQSGRETETFAIVMAIFLTINLIVSALMNWLNARLALPSAR